MASNVEQSPFFQQRKTKGEPIVKEPPKFDLESYISNYAGFTRVDRLHHIGSHSPYLAVDAYRLAITEAKKGKNVDLYTKLAADLSSIVPDDPAALIDTAWAEKKTRETQLEQNRLEHELKSYKNNLIKESIRMGNEDIGHFFYDTGDYSSALKAYMKMREHCTSNKHLADMTLRLVYVSIAQKSWLGVQANLAKVDAAQLKGDDKTKLEPIVAASSGLTHMSIGNFREAATHFLGTSPAFLTVEPAANITWQKEVLTGNDVAVYGGLCALASMDRTDLQNKVLGNNDFRNFLELEPHIRRAINLFCNSKYSACLEVLEGYRNDYLLDVYLSKVLVTIYGRIRTKSIVQYFIPFSCVTLDEMASKFPASEDKSIEDELESLINNRTLNARIDLVDRLLISPPTNPRHSVHAEALAMAETYDHTLRLRLTRLNMLAAGMEIKQEKGSADKMSSDTGVGIGASLRGLGSKMGFT
ncbi:PCI-domain-containing protein [Dothidotthia symphoricarpi CBS 119687]|uniref:COP9 signalosome complex subunit 1 n=1 Tax=Dothidotthia symphoricarpi CBS 119687 TaxID=1392245 RepID=A0A6A6AN03_9PLEO|nr:PCI-domain-containing protein [Dothidotthia symphoricarpi CBS 119687]KAF2132314.1 PCI-domain-containing protein [Dothidotthia symphoricarpi CBS 119687]